MMDVIFDDQLGRRSTKTSRGCKKSSIYLYSDVGEEKDDSDSNQLRKRSASLTTLQQSISGSTGGEPRMAQLETLEAKMANIEVSLSSITAPRRRKNGSICGNTSTVSSNTSPKSAAKNELLLRELENLRHALKDKENVIQSLKGQLNTTNGRLNILRNSTARKLTPAEKQQAEERLGRLKTEMENKRTVIKSLKLALDRLDVNDNIDVRIKQAELEYQLGKEELNALGLLEEARALQQCLDESSHFEKAQSTFYSCTRGTSGFITLHSMELVYDPKSPKFAASNRETLGITIDWALEETGLCTGDRVIEINGKIVLNSSKDELSRIFTIAPDTAQVVVLRNNKSLPVNQPINDKVPQLTVKEITNLRAELDVVRDHAEETQRMKESLKSDNLRLTHRISYLEEQVAELLKQHRYTNGYLQDEKTNDLNKIITQNVQVKTNQNITSISINPPSVPTTPTRTTPRSNEVQVFQKGHVTALVANLPGLDTDNKDHLRTLKLKNMRETDPSLNSQIPALDDSLKTNFYKPRYHKNSPNGKLDYNSENSECGRRFFHKKYDKKSPISEATAKSVDELNQVIRDYDKSAKGVRSLGSMEFDSEPNHHYAKPLKVHQKMDYLSEPDANVNKYSSCEQLKRPKPPRKPMRLSLHKAQSLQSVDDEDGRRFLEQQRRLREKMERAERPERMEKLDRVDKKERMERVDRPERMERLERPERAERLERSEKMEKLERPERLKRPEISDKKTYPDCAKREIQEVESRTHRSNKNSLDRQRDDKREEKNFGYNLDIKVKEEANQKPDNEYENDLEIRERDYKTAEREYKMTGNRPQQNCNIPENDFDGRNKIFKQYNRNGLIENSNEKQYSNCDNNDNENKPVKQKQTPNNTLSSVEMMKMINKHYKQNEQKRQLQTQSYNNEQNQQNVDLNCSNTSEASRNEYLKNIRNQNYEIHFKMMNSHNRNAGKSVGDGQEHQIHSQNQGHNQIPHQNQELCRNMEQKEHVAQVSQQQTTQKPHSHQVDQYHHNYGNLQLLQRFNNHNHAHRRGNINKETSENKNSGISNSSGSQNSTSSYSSYNNHNVYGSQGNWNNQINQNNCNNHNGYNNKDDKRLTVNTYERNNTNKNINMTIDENKVMFYDQVNQPRPSSSQSSSLRWPGSHKSSRYTTGNLSDGGGGGGVNWC